MDAQLTAAVAQITTRLDDVAVAKTKAWWERYLKGEIEFRGVPMAGIRKAVHAWHDGIESDLGLRKVSLALLRSRWAEDKLAGILILQELLGPADPAGWEATLGDLETVFGEESVG